MKLLLLSLIFLYGCVSDEELKKNNDEYYNRMKSPRTIVILNIQEAKSGWNHIDSKMFVRVLESGELMTVKGLWAKEGDTMKVTRGWLDDNDCRYCR